MRSTTPIIRRVRPTGEGKDAVSLGRQLGRPGPASARQFRRLHARRIEAEMAGSARHRTLDAFLHRLRPRSFSFDSSIIFCMKKRTAGIASHASSCRSGTSIASSSAPKTNGRSSGRNGPDSICIQTARSHPASAERTRDCCSRRWAMVLLFSRRHWSRRPRSPDRPRSSCSCPPQHETPTYSRSCAYSHPI